MEELIQTYSGTVVNERGTRYRVEAHGAKNELGTWHGWLEFAAEDGSHRLRTDRETTQQDRGDLEYWASGLEPVYFEGALARATPA